MPALLNATSTEPKASYAARKAAVTSASDVTSACTYSPPISAAAFSPAASSMSTATTWAPSAANRRAAASPIPLPAPVMTTVLPSNLMSLLCRDERRRGRRSPSNRRIGLLRRGLGHRGDRLLGGGIEHREHRH